MDEEEAVKIFDLVVKGKMLPATLDKLVPLSFIGSAAVSFYKAKVKLMDQLGMAMDQQDATLEDGQGAGEMLLDIESRIGELSKQMPRELRNQKTVGRVPEDQRGRTKAKKIGLSSEQALRNAQTIHSNPAAVAAVKAEAKANRDIPTKTAVLNRIRYEKEKQRQSKAKAAPVSALEATAAEAQYINALEQCLSFLPKKPPKQWTKNGLRVARGYAKIIIGRLEVFDEV